MSIDREIQAILRSHDGHIVSAYLFGSCASGQTFADSDVDVAILVSEPGDADQERIVSELVRDLEKSCGHAADVVVLNDAPSIFAFDILRTGRKLYCTDEAASVLFETEVRDRYADLRPLEAICRRYLLRRASARKMLARDATMIDRRTVENLIAYVQEMLNRLSIQRGKALDEFEKDFVSVDAALHELQTMLEAVSDIATHVIAGANLGSPPDRPTAIEMLAQNGILPQSLAEKMSQAVRMRNVLVHHYPGVNTGKVHHVIQNELGDVQDFCARVAEFLERECPDSAPT